MERNVELARRLISIITDNAEIIRRDFDHEISSQRINYMVLSLRLIKECCEKLENMLVEYKKNLEW